MSAVMKNNHHTCTQKMVKKLSKMKYTAISIKVVGSFRAYATRPRGSVGSCISVFSFTAVSSWSGTSDFLVSKME